MNPKDNNFVIYKPFMLFLYTYDLNISLCGLFLDKDNEITVHTCCDFSFTFFIVHRKKVQWVYFNC